MTGEMSAPDLHTARLTLRGHGLDDFAESAALWGDEVVTRHIGGRPFTREECWTRLLRHAGHWALLGFGYWVVRERATGRFVGEVGLAELRRDLAPSIEGVPEAGWVLAPWAHGQGFAGEAVTAVLAWADGVLRAPRTVCIIDPDNAASLRVAARAGFREVTRTTYKGGPTVLFERLAP
jgi:RimJ/RimL family protein N-acetyltransferase